MDLRRDDNYLLSSQHRNYFTEWKLVKPISLLSSEKDTACFNSLSIKLLNQNIVYIILKFAFGPEISESQWFWLLHVLLKPTIPITTIYYNNLETSQDVTDQLARCDWLGRSAKSSDWSTDLRFIHQIDPFGNIADSIWTGGLFNQCAE